MKYNRLAALLLSICMCIIFIPCEGISSAEPDDTFYDDFDTLDESRWLIAQKNWGGTVTENGETSDYNGGVIPENVAAADGRLILSGLGNDYNGVICGINRNKTRRSSGKRCGGAIATRDYFASGSY